MPLARVLGAARERAAEFISNCCFLYWNSWLQPEVRSDESLHTSSQHPLCGRGLGGRGRERTRPRAGRSRSFERQSSTSR